MTTQPVKFLTCNTHLFVGSAGGLAPEYEDVIRREAIIPKLAASGVDIIGLCEVWAPDSSRKFVNELLREYPFSYWNPPPKGIKNGSGLLLLSKSVIVDATFTAFTDLVGWDAVSEKGFITAIVTIKTESGYQPVHVVLTHTQAGNTDSEAEARQSNLQQIWTAVRNMPFGNNPVVLFGDLNVEEEAYGRPTIEYTTMKNLFAPLGLKDLCREIYPSTASDPFFTFDPSKNALAEHFDPGSQASRLDYVFVNNFGTEPIEGSRFGMETGWHYTDPATGRLMDLSDHYPLTACMNAGTSSQAG